MENRLDQSILDYTLRARYLRGAYLARLIRRGLHRIRASHGQAAAVPRDSGVAFERR